MRVWRCVHDAYADEAWTGEGARRYGGRYNRVGDALVYTSADAALAVVEVLAGNVTSMDLVDWRLLQAEVPDPLVHDGEGGDPIEEGTAFLAAGRLALRVPSVVVPGANLLLNPDSAKWGEVRILDEVPLDPRLWS